MKKKLLFWIILTCHCLNAKEILFEKYTKDPANPQLNFEMGYYYHELGNLEKAREFYERTLALDRKFVSAYINLANIESQLLRYEIAENYYLIALALNPQNADIYYNLGSLYQLQGKLAQAVENFEKALFYNKNLKEAHLNIATCFLKLYTVNYDKNLLKLAKEHLMKAGRLDRTYAHVYFNLGMLAELENQPGIALHHYREALRYYKENSPQYEKTKTRILFLEKQMYEPKN